MSVGTQGVGREEGGIKGGWERNTEREREEDVRREGVRVQRRHDCMLLWIDGGGVEERGCTNDVLRISRAKAKKKRKKRVRSVSVRTPLALHIVTKRM